MPEFIIGDFITEELEARGWTVEDLAAKSLITATRLREVIKTGNYFTRSIARGLSDAFGTSEQFWLNLRDGLKNARVRERQEAIRASRARGKDGK